MILALQDGLYNLTYFIVLLNFRKRYYKSLNIKKVIIFDHIFIKLDIRNIRELIQK